MTKGSVNNTILDDTDVHLGCLQPVGLGTPSLYLDLCPVTIHHVGVLVDKARSGAS